MNDGEIKEHEGHEGFKESSQLLTAKIAKSDIIVVRGEDASHSAESCAKVFGARRTLRTTKDTKDSKDDI